MPTRDLVEITMMPNLLSQFRVLLIT